MPVLNDAGLIGMVGRSQTEVIEPVRLVLGSALLTLKALLYRLLPWTVVLNVLAATGDIRTVSGLAIELHTDLVGTSQPFVQREARMPGRRQLCSKLELLSPVRFSTRLLIPNTTVTKKMRRILQRNRLFDIIL